MNRETFGRKIKMIGWIALGLTGLFVATIVWRVDDWSRDWSQNTASLDSQSPRPELRPLNLDVGHDQAVEALKRFCQADPKWEFVSAGRLDEKTSRVELTRTTSVFRFVDDIEVTISQAADSGGVVIHATSGSRLGKGDLGQNPRNLIELTRGLADREPTT